MFAFVLLQDYQKYPHITCHSRYSHIEACMLKVCIYISHGIIRSFLYMLGALIISVHDLKSRSYLSVHYC